jgi:hypothetical protein
MKKPIAFSSFGGYRRFCVPWWLDLLWYVSPIQVLERTYWEGLSWRDRVEIDWPGWCRDVYAYWHRARYGWAPRDTWGLDSHLNRVLAGSLWHLAEHHHGAPAGYPNLAGSMVDDDTNFDQWQADLRRWAQACAEDPNDVDIYDRADGYAKHNAEEARRTENLHRALKEIEPWWQALWD